MGPVSLEDASKSGIQKVQTQIREFDTIIRRMRGLLQDTENIHDCLRKEATRLEQTLPTETPSPICPTVPELSELSELEEEGDVSFEIPDIFIEKVNDLAALLGLKEEGDDFDNSLVQIHEYLHEEWKLIEKNLKNIEKRFDMEPGEDEHPSDRLDSISDAISCTAENEQIAEIISIRILTRPDTELRPKVEALLQALKGENVSPRSIESAIMNV